MWQPADDEEIQFLTLTVCCSEAKTTTDPLAGTANAEERRTKYDGTSSLEERLSYWCVARNRH